MFGIFLVRSLVRPSISFALAFIKSSNMDFKKQLRYKENQSPSLTDTKLNGKKPVILTFSVQKD
jgi:hypothetical protein